MNIEIKKYSTKYSQNINEYIKICKLSNNNITRKIVHNEMNSLFIPKFTNKLKKLSIKELIHLFKDDIIDENKINIENIISYYFPFYILKDIPILNYHLGLPISKKEAEHNFIEKDIKIDRLSPKKRSQYYNASDNLYLDVINFQWLPESEFVQLKETGELLEKNIFNEYIQNNKTIWCGKQNIGFKSPSDYIFGNLVLYNYDNIDFFPQKSGTLYISKIKNTNNIPCYKKNGIYIYPEFYFLLSYSGYYFYLPDTEDGRIVLCLMKDAFKKGNLFAFPKYSTIPRHGRIHKKTTLMGIYGYPDDTYLERVIGELNSLGSSPFTYQFSNDPYYIIENDPYPLEKRFKIIVSL